MKHCNWKITDKGFLFIREVEQNRYSVVIDPGGLYEDFAYWSKVDGGNNLANLEIPTDWNNWHARIIAYWRSLGSPTYNGNDNKWFDWIAAGFTPAEVEKQYPTILVFPAPTPLTCVACGHTWSYRVLGGYKPVDIHFHCPECNAEVIYAYTPEVQP
jgi:hypothetical protein